MARPRTLPPARRARYGLGMTGFLTSLGVEFAARRRRLRKALGDGRASLLEFVLLLGVTLGVASPAFGPKHFLGGLYGPFLPLLLAVGYGLLDVGRQRLVAGGQAEQAIAAAFDRRALWFCLAVALIGYLTFVWALFAPPPFELVPDMPPPGAVDVTLG